MKTKPLTLLLALTFLFLFSGSVYGEEPVHKQYWDNGNLKWETYYNEEQEKGLGVGWFKSGKKEVEVPYNVSQEGKELSLKKDGQLNLWYENSNRRSVEFYKKGELEGLLTTWYESGEKWSESNYKNGKRDGLTTSWYKSGNKKEEFSYKNGKQNGLSTLWDEDGNKLKEIFFKNGIRTEVF